MDEHYSPNIIRTVIRYAVTTVMETALNVPLVTLQYHYEIHTIIMATWSHRIRRVGTYIHARVCVRGYLFVISVREYTLDTRMFSLYLLHKLDYSVLHFRTVSVRATTAGNAYIRLFGRERSGNARRRDADTYNVNAICDESFSFVA